MKRQGNSPRSGWTNIHRDHVIPRVFDPAGFDPIEVLDTLDVPIVIVHRDFTIACFNRQAAETLGLAASDIGHSAREAAGFANSRNLERWCEQAILAGTFVRHDFRYQDQTFVLRIAPYFHGDRQLSGTVLTFSNVTAFRASIDAAIYEREYAKAIVNAGTDPLIVLNQDLRLQTANRAFYEMFGVTREALPSVSLDTLENGAFDLVRLHAQLRELLHGTKFEPFEIDHEFVTAGPRRLILDAHLLSLSDPSRRAILLSFRDITLHQKAVAANARLSAIIQSSDDAILSKDLNGTIMSWNRGAENIFGYKSDEVIGQPITILTPADRPNEEPSILERVRRGEHIEQYETVRRQRAGLW